MASRAAPRSPQESPDLVRQGLRYALMMLGFAITVIGVAVFFVPFTFHVPGILLIALGMVLVLRNSFTARRKFIRAQRRHPHIVYPVRRLLKRKPEFAPVFWHLLLKTERFFVPRRFRVCRKLRRRLTRRRSSPSAA